VGEQRYVVLVCGPPCAGKSTWVAHHAQPGDLILDHDYLAQQAGSPHTHAHSKHHHDLAAARFDELCEQVHRSDTGRAYVIRCAANPNDRRQLAERIRADRVVVLIPPFGVTLRRASGHRPKQAIDAIYRWYRLYQPTDLDETVATPAAPLPVW